MLIMIIFIFTYSIVLLVYKTFLSLPTLLSYINSSVMLNIDDLLKEKGLTKTDVAKRMNLSRESLYRILSGNPTLENIQKLADSIEVPITDLFEQPATDTVSCPFCGNKIRVSKE